MAGLSVDRRPGDAKRMGRQKESPLRKLRLARGLTQARLAALAGMHRNSIAKLENGTTREVTAENASALAAVLNTPAGELGLVVRPEGTARAIRIRQLTAEQRAIVDELLSLPPEDYALVREAIETLRRSRSKPKPRRRGARS